MLPEHGTTLVCARSVSDSDEGQGPERVRAEPVSGTDRCVSSYAAAARPAPPATLPREPPGCVRVVPVGVQRAAAVQSTADQPFLPPARWVDQGEPPPFGRGRFASDDPSHLVGTDRKPNGERFAIRSQGGLDLFAREHHQPCRDARRPPAELPTDSIDIALVPTELALDGPEVVEPRLDVDDDEGPGPSVERDEVDPPMRSTMDDLELALGDPARSPEMAIEIAGAACVDDLALSTGDHHRRPSQEIELEAERVADADDQIQRRIGATRFDRRDVRPRHPDGIGQNLLRDVERGPRVAAQPSEGQPKWRWHVGIEADATSLALTWMRARDMPGRPGTHPRGPETHPRVRDPRAHVTVRHHFSTDCSWSVTPSTMEGDLGTGTCTAVPIVCLGLTRARRPARLVPNVCLGLTLATSARERRGEDTAAAAARGSARIAVGYAWRVMPRTTTPAGADRRPGDPDAARNADPDAARNAAPDAARNTARNAGPPTPLPANDAALFEQDLRGLRRRWADRAALPPIGAEAMTGADRRAQALGVTEERLMEHAGTAVAAAVRALAVDTGRWGTGPIVILSGPGNNGGDGFVAARRLALAGAQVVVAVIAADARPHGVTSARNWDRIARDTGIAKVHAPVARDVAMFGQGIGRAAVIVDALLGTGVRGPLREPIRSAVELIDRAQAAGVPVVAVDTPTAVDLSSGEPSDPAVRADLTVTFHRPRTGLLTRRGAAYAGKILVAPIGIPPEADRG